jgi:hypothetical protein
MSITLTLILESQDVRFSGTLFLPSDMRYIHEQLTTSASLKLVRTDLDTCIHPTTDSMKAQVLPNGSAKRGTGCCD